MKLDDLTIAKTLDAVNQRFYEVHHQGFDGTRQFGWPGWSKVIKEIGSPTPMILDVGCGNGRFARFLNKHQHANPTSLFTGIDRCEHLLSSAAANTYEFPSKWTHFDWTEPLFGAERHSPSTHYDLVVAFGVIHHIYHSDFRFKFLDWCAQHLSPGGHLIVSAWDFGRHEKFRQKAAAPDIVLSQTGIDLKALGPHDYFLSFGQQAAPLRYCHWMNDQESSNLIGRLLDAQKSLKLTARIEDPDDLNRYWVFTDTQR